MRILVLTINAWNNANSTGNTISNLFSALSSEDEIANIYCRNEVISNTICRRYFKITENDVLCNLFSPQKCGNVVSAFESDDQKCGFNILAKNRTGDFLRKHRFVSLLFLRELIWKIPTWKNLRLERFLVDFAPDIIYMYGHDNLYMYRLLDYCVKKTGAKTVLFFGDDVYGRKSRLPLGYLYETLLRKCYHKAIEQSALLFGGSLKLCDEYMQIFSRKFIPFFKECKPVQSEGHKLGNPITIVYAGNLLFGREQMIVNFVKAIAKVNAKRGAYMLVLKIFSNTNPTESSMAIMDDKKNCYFMGCKPYDEVCKEMDKSDMALFIESFDRRYVRLTRLSFSTKIIDCMQSTAAILAIGPQDIAPIDYLLRNNLGYVISNPGEIEDRMEYLLNHIELIQEKKCYKAEFARIHHTNTSSKALNEMRLICRPND